MATLTVIGDRSGRHYIDEKYIEAMVLMGPNPRGMSTVAIRMASRREYFVNFATPEEARNFVASWAGKSKEFDRGPK